MKLKKRKIKYAGIFLLCWLTLLVFLVDGILNFQILVDYFSSYAFVETASPSSESHSERCTSDWLSWLFHLLGKN